ncbi:MAG TPA: glycerol-3-phosphate dehydrogenase/oxidase [Streptosporangiaceae bacterium]|nr:glycerol-3-phosphate dehydrogenase/oxidase [Streptosporangiaceae bacterium]
MLTFSAETRAASLARMAEDAFDVLVIGGGITGTGIALDAASRGLSVALVEKDDFAAGTSGRSSRLVHGGLRYLEHGDLGLVRESLRERGTLYQLAPHLVRPVPMYMLAGDLRRRTLYRAGLTVYEALAAGRNIGYHQGVSADQVAAAVPGLGGRTRGVRYFECQADDARLTIEVARTAHAYGARLANHARVTGLLGEGRVTGAAVTDELTGQGFEVRARAVVNAAGIWAAEVTALAGGAAGHGGTGGGIRLSPSKGVHLVFAPGAVRTTAAMVAPAADGRYVFIVPWEDRVYAGTTDTPYDGDLDSPAVGEADRDYILSAVTPMFPGVTGRDVVASWAGLRPLLGGENGGDADAATADLSRKHAIFDEPPGLFTITGGKLTTYRAMAQDLVDRVAAALGTTAPCRTRDIPLGLHGSPAAAVRLARDEVRRLGLPPPAAARLVQRYGDDWREAVALIEADRTLGDPAVAGLPVLGVELALARSREMALTDDDVLVRRTRLTTRDASVRLTPSA